MEGRRVRSRGAAVLIAGVGACLAATLPGPLPDDSASGAAPVSSTVLVVVSRPTTPSAGDQEILARLQSLGLTPVLADDNTVGPGDATGHAFVLVAQTAKHWLAGVASLSAATAPLVVAQPQLFDDYGLTGPTLGTHYGNRRATDVVITDPAHPLAAGYSGTVTIQTGSTTRMSWGVPTASGHTVATSGPRSTIFAVAAGDPLFSGQPAPACRLSFPAGDIGVRRFTAAGWAMFDAAATWLAAGCSTPPPEPPADPPGEDVTHVVAISVDGLSPAAWPLLGPADIPSYHRLAAEGSSTLNARTMIEVTRTLPNHTSMVTGRRIDLPGGHGVTFNYKSTVTVHQAAGEYVHSVFDLVHDAGGTTALYVGKPKFDVLDQSWNAVNGAPDTTGPDNGRDKIDIYVNHVDSGRLTELLVERLLSNPPSFSFLHLDNPDDAGHTHGWLSPEYLQAVRRTDELVGAVLDAVAGDPGLAASTVVVLTGDHGGTGTGHLDTTDPANYTIPFFVWGDGVPAGEDLYVQNPERLDPATGQPAYDVVQPVRNGEVANLATGLLDLGAIPGSEFNADLGLGPAAP
ncbi:alkaline phosphatase family protein [Nocardioides coralli]|uniref:alkaline phosphatase family protein n=1 Tax=Nocardioides coralli TaxID=2872154 RepID=UPI001CA39F95|nr:alkaline phosphatase family protein [Nocardioides coralli]QZY28715.1 alkaline phosphatase family protein [Nocardioides coralli]